MDGGVCANHLHLCILFDLDLVSTLQLVILSVTVKICHPLGPLVPFQFPVGAVLWYFSSKCNSLRTQQFNDHLLVQ